MEVKKDWQKQKLEDLLVEMSTLRSNRAKNHNKGNISGVARCERLLKLNYAHIREHCARHDLELPNGVPFEDAQ